MQKSNFLRKKFLNAPRGITLISLIITIIILLILAVVTLNLVGDGGILDKTENAVKDTISAEAQEDTQMLISGLIMKYHQEVDVDADGNPLKTGQEYIEKKLADGQKTSSGKYFVKAEDGAVITFEGDSAEDATQDNKVANGFLAENGAVEWHEVVEIPSELNVGDYVTYEPSGTYNWEAKYASSDLADDGSADVLLASGNKVTDENQDMSLTSWRVFSINQVTGKVELVPSKPTTRTVRLQGAQGYNNCVKLLNDACSILYGNKELGISARSINIEDFEGRMTPEALEEAHSYVNPSSKVKYGYQPTNAYTICNQYPVIYGTENLNVIDGVQNTGLNSSEQTILIGRMDKGATEGNLTASKSIKPYQTWWFMSSGDIRTAFKGDGTGTSNMNYNLIIPQSGSSNYLIASRCVDAFSGYSVFGLNLLNGGGVSFAQMFNSGSGSISAISRGLFPVVWLNINLLTGNDTEGWKVQ